MIGVLLVMVAVRLVMWTTVGNASGSDWLWFLPVLVVVVTMALMMFVVGPRMMHHTQGSGSEDDTPSQILQKRFARGELTQQQYEEMDQALRDHTPQP